MDIFEKLTTLARKYCMEQRDYWIEQHDLYRRSFGTKYPYKHSEKDYTFSSRYGVLNEILDGVELHAGRQYSDFSECKKTLLDAAWYERMYVETAPNGTLNTDGYDERLKYQSFILHHNPDTLIYLEVEPLPYCRKLTPEESKHIREQLQEKWQCSGTYWVPMVEIPDIDVLYLMDNYVEPYEDKISAVVRHIALDKIYRLNEGIIDNEYEIDSFSLELYEALWCDRTFDWVIYGSHEGTITFAGEKLVSEVRKLLKPIRAKFNVVEYLWDTRE